MKNNTKLEKIILSPLRESMSPDILSKHTSRGFVMGKSKKQKELEELREKVKAKIETEELSHKVTEARVVVDNYKDEIKTLFNKSNTKEVELKNYIATLNSKMLSADIQYDDGIDIMHGDIMDMINDIQEKVKQEISHTKKEMEEEVTVKFSEAEQRQQKLMNEKIDEQKKVFERMSHTKGEIDKIKKHFENTNVQCEVLLKENENLRILQESLENDNSSLNKKLVDLKAEYIKLATEHKKLFKNENIENPLNITIENNNTPSSKNSFEDLENIDVENSKENETMEIIEPEIISNKNKNEYSADHIIKMLKDSIKSARKEFKDTYTNFVDIHKKRNEAQQLLQKCIEDVNLDLKKASKDIQNFIKLSNNVNKGYEEQLKAKQLNLESLEYKLKILTFVYDNGMQSIKSKKIKLFSK